MDEFTVADVYEHAAKIGQDIDHMIRNYGESSVEQIMPKIVFTLEQLEGLTEKVQKDTSVINELNAEKEKYVIQCKKESALKRQLEEKVDYLEDLLNEDTKNLQSTISKLTKENELLKCEVEQLDEEIEHQKTSALPGDVDLMVKMKVTIDAQRDQLRQLSMQGETQKTEIEALNEQTNRLTEINERLRLYNSKLQDRLAKTVQHKVQAEATLASVQMVNGEQEVAKEGADGVAIKEHSDAALSTSNQVEIETKEKSSVDHPVESSELQKNEEQRESEVKAQNVEKKTEETNESNKETKDKQQPVKKDPNRPRYTLAEMQQVLEERNRYKEKVSMLEDVLEAYLPKSSIRSSTLEPGDAQIRKSKSKHTPKKESRVRGIFGSFWKESSSKDHGSK